MSNLQLSTDNRHVLVQQRQATCHMAASVKYIYQTYPACSACDKCHGLSTNEVEECGERKLNINIFYLYYIVLPKSNALGSLDRFECNTVFVETYVNLFGIKDMISKCKLSSKAFDRMIKLVARVLIISSIIELSIVVLFCLMFTMFSKNTAIQLIGAVELLPWNCHNPWYMTTGQKSFPRACQLQCNMLHQNIKGMRIFGCVDLCPSVGCR